jgi:hypothetical protein
VYLVLLMIVYFLYSLFYWFGVVLWPFKRYSLCFLDCVHALSFLTERVDLDALFSTVYISFYQFYNLVIAVSLTHYMILPLFHKTCR